VFPLCVEKEDLDFSIIVRCFVTMGRILGLHLPRVHQHLG
jgi:hypothetical protein